MENKPDIFYECDRKACENCHDECHHTEKIEHAKNFIKKGGAYFEHIETIDEIKQLGLLSETYKSYFEIWKSSIYINLNEETQLRYNQICDILNTLKMAIDVLKTKISGGDNA